MRAIILELNGYIRSLPLPAAAISLLLTALLIFCNYHYGIEPQMMALPVMIRIVAWYVLFAATFWIPWMLQGAPLQERNFLLLWLLAPAIFSLKLALPLPAFPLIGDQPGDYWQRVLYYPYKLALIAGLLYLVWRRFDADRPYYGTGVPRTSIRPYMLMLLIMVPLVALASTQHDFLSLYPKFWHYESVRHSTGPQKFLYELSYGSDFITIELFFRGFLVLAFARYGGYKAILPMAVFYCSIHFGKPLGECISSFFGGIVLGVVSYHTRSIRGGLMVHLGIAWLMELGGWAGHLFFL
jgi:hypothetical protein